MESMLTGWVTSEDPKERARMQKNAELIQTHGHDAVLALMGGELVRKPQLDC